jgi:hypothetical protein
MGVSQKRAILVLAFRLKSALPIGIPTFGGNT